MANASFEGHRDSPVRAGDIPDDLIFVPRLVAKAKSLHSRLVVHALGERAVAGYAGEAWREAQRGRQATVFGHAATTSCWPVLLERTQRHSPLRHAAHAARRDGQADRLEIAFGVNEDGLVATLMLLLPPEVAVEALLRRAAVEHAALSVRLNRVDDDALSAEWTAELQGEHAWLRGRASARFRARVRLESERLAMVVAERHASTLPPLPEAADWNTSEVHRAARSVIAELGARAFRKGWTPQVLANRVETAMEFLRRARAGGLGAAPWRTEDTARCAAGESMLITSTMIAEVLDNGGDPLHDPRTRVAYQICIPRMNTVQVLADDAAMMRLREVPELVNEYLGMRWLRYAPLSAALAHALVLKECVLFGEQILRWPSGVLDENHRSGESRAFQWSGRGRRPWMITTFRALQQLIGRVVTTSILAVAVTLLEMPFAWWATLAWFFGAGRLRTAVFGKTRAQVQGDLLTVMGRISLTMRDDNVPVAALRHALQDAHVKGVVFDEVLWRLVADAERRGDSVWPVRPAFTT